MDRALVPHIVIIACTILAGIIDARTFRVPNKVSIPILLSGMVYHSVTGGIAGLQESLIGALFGFAVVFLMFIIGGMGAGDVKLMAAIGAWLGVQTTLYVFFVAAMITGAYSVIMLIRQKRLQDGFKMVQVAWLQLCSIGKHLGAEDNVEALVKRNDKRNRLIPFGTMLMVAVIMVVVWIRWLQP